MTLTLLNILIAFAGIWRLSSLFANEDGPFHVFAFIRETAQRVEETNTRAGRLMRDFHFYKGLCCEWCNSIWIGIPFVLAWTLLGDGVLKLILPFTLSAFVIAFKYFVHTLEQVCSYFDNLNKQFKRGA